MIFQFLRDTSFQVGVGSQKSKKIDDSEQDESQGKNYNQGRREQTLRLILLDCFAFVKGH